VRGSTAYPIGRGTRTKSRVRHEAGGAGKRGRGRRNGVEVGPRSPKLPGLRILTFSYPTRTPAETWDPPRGRGTRLWGPKGKHVVSPSSCALCGRIRYLPICYARCNGCTEPLRRGLGVERGGSRWVVRGQARVGLWKGKSIKLVSCTSCIVSVLTLNVMPFFA
jgi:hypothetical protein